jgi:hypothetical protein
MNDARIDRLLDELVEPFETRTDGWADVRARSRRAGGRYALLAAAVAALLLVPAAVALRGQIASLFQGTPAPPEISSSFEANNRVADMATQKGFGDRFPHADVSRAHGVIEVQTPDGPEDLWAAPTDQGGQCWWVDFVNDPSGPGAKYGFGTCDTTQTSAPIEPGLTWLEPHATLMTLFGRVHVKADRVAVRLEDGTGLTLPVVEGAFLASVDNGSRLAHISAFEGNDEVASWEAPVG